MRKSTISFPCSERLSTTSILLPRTQANAPTSMKIISYCQLDSAIVETLIASCEGYFLPVELASLRRFVETHSDSGNVMALVKRRVVIVEQRPQ